jgi:polyisoprenoid-binding protein YceI
MSVPTSTATAVVVPEGTWTIDPAHSTVEFAVRYLGIVTVNGRASRVDGTITGGDTPTIEGVVPVAGLTTFDETRDAHLMSPDFFDAERYPELRFASKAVAGTAEELTVDGELTIKGVTKPVRLTGTFSGRATDPWGNERIGIDLAGSIDRNDFGVSWNAPLPGGGFLLHDRVALSASFSAVKAA